MSKAETEVFYGLICPHLNLATWLQLPYSMCIPGEGKWTGREREAGKVERGQREGDARKDKKRGRVEKKGLRG